MNRLETAQQKTLTDVVRVRGNPALADDILRGRFVVLAKPTKGGREIRLVARDLAEWLDEPPEADPTNVGEYWGVLSEDAWTPSLEAAVRIGAMARGGRVIVNEQAQQLFLYGRDVLGSSILEADRSTKVGETVWVCGPTGDVIGIAEVIAPWRTSGAVLRPLMDLGWYLREGG